MRAQLVPSRTYPILFCPLLSASAVHTRSRTCIDDKVFKRPINGVSKHFTHSCSSARRKQTLSLKTQHPSRSYTLLYISSDAFDMTTFSDCSTLQCVKTSSRCHRPLIDSQPSDKLPYSWRAMSWISYRALLTFNWQ